MPRFPKLENWMWHLGPPLRSARPFPPCSPGPQNFLDPTDPLEQLGKPTCSHFRRPTILGSTPMTRIRRIEQHLKGCRPSRPQTWPLLLRRDGQHCYRRAIPDARLRPPASVLAEHADRLSMGSPDPLPPRTCPSAPSSLRGSTVPVAPAGTPPADAVASGSPLVAIPLRPPGPRPLRRTASGFAPYARLQRPAVCHGLCSRRPRASRPVASAFRAPVAPLIRARATPFPVPFRRALHRATGSPPRHRRLPLVPIPTVPPSAASPRKPSSRASLRASRAPAAQSYLAALATFPSLALRSDRSREQPPGSRRLAHKIALCRIELRALAPGCA
jgi:hypothetical protein